MKMVNFLSLNAGWILLALVGLGALIFSATKFRMPVPVVPTTKSANFATDSVVSTPVMANNQWANVFHDAAVTAIGPKKVNPWVYLHDHWSKAKEFHGVEPAMLDFIQKEAGRTIPENSIVSLSIRDYSNENSVVMEYRDPKKDSIMITTGHDPEPALYATFANKKGESKTYKLICANGLVRELGYRKVISFNQDYVIKKGDNFIKITGSTPIQAYEFALKNNLIVQCVVNDTIVSKTPEATRRRVFADYKKYNNSIFNVVIKQNNILRKENGKYLYIKK